MQPHLHAFPILGAPLETQNQYLGEGSEMTDPQEAPKLKYARPTAISNAFESILRDAVAPQTTSAAPNVIKLERSTKKIAVDLAQSPGRDEPSFHTNSTAKFDGDELNEPIEGLRIHDPKDSNGAQNQENETPRKPAMQERGVGTSQIRALNAAELEALKLSMVARSPDAGIQMISVIVSPDPALPGAAQLLSRSDTQPSARQSPASRESHGMTHSGNLQKALASGQGVPPKEPAYPRLFSGSPESPKYLLSYVQESMYSQSTHSTLQNLQPKIPAPVVSKDETYQIKENNQANSSAQSILVGRPSDSATISLLVRASESGGAPSLKPESGIRSAPAKVDFPPHTEPSRNVLQKLNVSTNHIAEKTLRHDQGKISRATFMEPNDHAGNAGSDHHVPQHKSKRSFENNVQHRPGESVQITKLTNLQPPKHNLILPEYTPGRLAHFAEAATVSDSDLGLVNSDRQSLSSQFNSFDVNQIAKPMLTGFSVMNAQGLSLPPSEVDDLKIEFGGATKESSTVNGRAITLANTLQTNAQNPEIARQIILQIAETIQQSRGQHHVEIALDPRELGKVKIALSGSETSMIVHITAERPETLELMRRHIAFLSVEFSNIGYKNSEFSFSQDLEQGLQRSEHAPHQDTTDDIAAKEPGMVQTSLPHANDRLDIRL